jgi:hypothetical protein
MESRYVAAVRGGPEFWGWDLDRYLLAAVYDAINANTYTTARVAGQKKAKKPDPFPRPEKSAKRKNNPNSFRAMAARLIGKARSLGDG